MGQSLPRDAGMLGAADIIEEKMKTAVEKAVTAKCSVWIRFRKDGPDYGPYFATSNQHKVLLDFSNAIHVDILDTANSDRASQKQALVYAGTPFYAFADSIIQARQMYTILKPFDSCVERWVQPSTNTSPQFLGGQHTIQYVKVMQLNEEGEVRTKNIAYNAKTFLEGGDSIPIAIAVSLTPFALIKRIQTKITTPEDIIDRARGPGSGNGVLAIKKIKAKRAAVFYTTGKNNHAQVTGIPACHWHAPMTLNYKQLLLIEQPCFPRH